MLKIRETIWGFHMIIQNGNIVTLNGVEKGDIRVTNGKIVEINVEGADMSKAKIFRVDENNTYTPYTKTSFVDGKLTLRMERNTVLYIEA